MNEPSVLDYVKSKIFFWRGYVVEIPPPGVDSAFVDEPGTRFDVSTSDVPTSDAAALPRPDVMSWPGWWVMLPLLLALAAQRALEPPTRSILLGMSFYLLAAGFLLWGSLRGRVTLPAAPAQPETSDPMTVRPLGMWISIVFGLLAFLAFGGNRFTQINLLLWLISLAAFFYAFWYLPPDAPTLREKLRTIFERFKSNGIIFSPWSLLVLAVFALSAFYRFYQLDRVPPEMFSDHAEKLYDVADVLAGKYSIFFPRNTGREAFQMYLTAAMSLIFNTDLSFLSLKLGTAFAGLFTLPFIYLLGKEVASRRAGLLAMAFAGIAYWPNVIARVALRFALYPFFAAPTLYFLVRGLRRGSRNDFLLAGLFLGLGLHGYSPFRFVPFVVLAAVGVYLLHKRPRAQRRQAIWGLILLVFVSLLIFAPLLRYALSDMPGFTYRTMTRMSEVEQPFPEPVWQIFTQNLWAALTMFFWDDGEIWVHSVTHRPALGMVSAALFALGGLMLTVRYLRRRNWLDLFWLISIPLLMMPSILSLAFPDENPSLNRTGAALIPVFLIVGMTLDGFLNQLERSSRVPARGQWLVWGVGILLLGGSCAQNFDLVFNQYRENFARSSWNTSELGAVIRQFADTIGDEDSAWVVPYPHWVDTRLVGMRADVPLRDYALWPDQIADTLDNPLAKLFLYKLEDTDTRDMLETIYPNGAVQLYDSAIEGKDFYIYFVPPEQ
ncbi:MAG: glycosyltransferase family 39 protein [Anaerolineae bacterium]|nr:glycosyltransferase family 39 protein [Anaerolineae bacterium]